MIQLTDLFKQFSHKNSFTQALSGVSLSVDEGKIMGVIGESGAGKSTLIRCVNMLERPDSGTVVVDGQDMMSLSPNQLVNVRKNIGMIFQHFNLLASRTVWENVAFPLELSTKSKAEIKIRVDELLQLVGLEDKANEYPSKLSGGQKQRVSIARALASNPKVLLCDEATSALDPATTSSILALLKEINRRLNITILLITHEMEVVKKICDNVAVMNKGQLIEQGTIAEIFSHPKNELTRKFIDSSINIDLPSDYVLKLTPYPDRDKNLLLKLNISGDSDADAILSDMSSDFAANSNIVCAQIDNVGGVKFGVLIIEIYGAAGKEDTLINFLENRNLKIEKLGYV